MEAKKKKEKLYIDFNNQSQTLNSSLFPCCFLGKGKAPAMVRKERKRHRSKNQDPVNCLPDDMIRHILSKLGLRGIARVSTLSRRWRQVCLSLPFLNLDLQAFDIYSASSKLRVLISPFSFRLKLCNNAHKTLYVIITKGFFIYPTFLFFYFL